MPKKPPYQNRIELLQGTLDLLILQTLQWGPRHGYGISQAIRANSGEVLRVGAGEGRFAAAQGADENPVLPHRVALTGPSSPASSSQGRLEEQPFARRAGLERPEHVAQRVVSR